MTKDKQLRGIKLGHVLEKRRLGQALNIKEFAVLTGISYSVARDWFQMQGFPRLEGVVFWQDFVAWRNDRNGGSAPVRNLQEKAPLDAVSNTTAVSPSGLPSRAARILVESRK